MVLFLYISLMCEVVFFLDLLMFPILFLNTTYILYPLILSGINLLLICKLLFVCKGNNISCTINFSFWSCPRAVFRHTQAITYTCPLNWWLLNLTLAQTSRPAPSSNWWLYSFNIKLNSCIFIKSAYLEINSSLSKYAHSLMLSWLITDSEILPDNLLNYPFLSCCLYPTDKKKNLKILPKWLHSLQLLVMSHIG